MNRSLVCLPACLALLLGASLALAEGIVAEVYRSPHGGSAGFAVDPSDGSCWAITGKSVVHLDAEGNLACQYTRVSRPNALALNTTDGSCWVADDDGREIVHISRDGTELWRGSGQASGLSVDQRDGSLWFVSPNDPSTGHGSLAHLSAAGELLGTVATVTTAGRVAVSPLDGTLWVWDAGPPIDSPDDPLPWRVMHLASDGTVLEEWPGYGYSVSASTADGSCWAGSAYGDVLHVSADNQVLWAGTGFGVAPHVAAVNPSDGSCWVDFFASEPISNCGDTMVLLAADGSELRRLEPPQPGQLGLSAVNPADGSLWAGGGAGWMHLAADGSLLWKDRGLQAPYAVAVNPADGSYWVAGGGKCTTGTVQPSWIARYDALGNELWRKEDLASPSDLAPDPVDGSVWVADMLGVAHYAADGTRLAFPDTHGSGGPNWVAVDPRDRSIWVSDSDQLRHYGADGTLLKTITCDGIIYRAQLAPDGSLWAIGFLDNWPEADEGGTLVHVTADGTCVKVEGFRQLQSLSVDPRDGSVWTSDFGTYVEEPLPPLRITHLSADGTILWQGGQQCSATIVAVDPRNGNCWAVGSGPAYLFSPAGEELGHTEGAGYVTFFVTVNPADGTLWVLDDLSELCKVASSGPFTDVAATSWAASAVSVCAAAGVVKGYWDGSYHPAEQVTRDQMAVYIARAFCGGDAEVPEGPSTPSFSDVPPDFWAYKQIEYCKAQNIVQGYDGNYQPGVALDRAQMATFLARAMVPFADRPDLASYTAPSTPSFSDVAPDFWACKAIEYARLRYVARGYPDGTYHPGYPCTRDQMAVFVARAFHLFQ